MNSNCTSNLQSNIERLESRITPAAGFIFAASGGVVKTFADLDINGTYETLVDSFAPIPGYRGELRVACGDFDGDTNDELAIATASKDPRILVFQLATDGSRVGAGELFRPFAGTTTVGAWVAAGDLDGDGIDELVVGAGTGGPASVKIYSDTDRDSLLGDNLADTVPVFGATFKGGVRVAVGNTNNLPGDELIAAAGRGLNGQVKIYTDSNHDRNVSADAVGLLETFTPFGAKFTGGLIVGSGPMESAGNSGAEVAVSRSSAAKDFVIFTDIDGDGLVSDDPLFDTVLVSAKPVPGGIRLVMGDTDDSGSFVEVAAASGGGRSLAVQIFDDTGDMGSKISDNGPTDSFAAFSSVAPTNVAFGKVKTAQFSSNIPAAIPDLGAGALEAKMFVPANAGVIRDLDISIFISHTFNGDLDVTLTHVSSGISIVLFMDVGGTDEGFIIRLNDEVGTDIGAANNPIDGATTGQFNPQGTTLLSAFDGIDASGEWILSITDDSASDVGTLFGWTLHLST